MINDNGSCECRGGGVTEFNSTTKRNQCVCEIDFISTTKGCMTCDEAIPRCDKCEETIEVTQTLMGDHAANFSHNGNYL